MEELGVIKRGLDKANGSFTLEESSTLLTCFIKVSQELERLQKVESLYNEQKTINKTENKAAIKKA